MSNYTQPISVADLGNNKYLTNHEIKWDIGKKDSGFTYTVQSKFKFDVSVPKMFQWIFRPDDPKFLKAAALHDHMLESGWSRIEAGAVFHEALKADGVPKTKRFAMFLGVVLFKYQ